MWRNPGGAFGRLEGGEPHAHNVPALRVRLLGGFRAERIDLARPVGGWQRRSAKTLAKLLATYPEHALHREQILDILWPRLDLESALNSFGKALHAARRALEPELVPRKSSKYLQLSDSMLSLNVEHVVIDADRFEQLAEDALRRRDIAEYESALAAYGGELLPEDRYEDWCAERRGSLAELHVRLLVGLAEALEGRGFYNASADRLREALAQDPTREEVHRRLMRAYAEMGIRDQAVRQFHICQDVLRRELDLAPQHETVSLHQDLLADRIPKHSPERDRQSANSRPRQTAESGLTLGKPFVGREPVLRYLRERLTQAEGREAGLILLSGEAGVGKTRLLEEFAAEANRQEAAVLWGGSGAHGNHLTYGPFAVALEGYVASRPEAERNGLAQRYPALARFLPSLPMNSQMLFGVDPSGDQLDLPPTIVRLLTDLGRRQPVLLGLGDVQDSDPDSLDLLRYLAHLAVTRRWLMIGALREEEVEAGTELRQTIDAMVRERLCLKIDLQCLSRRECDQLVRALLSGDRVGDELLEQIYTLSRGNPLFVDELVREMHARGELVLTSDCWHGTSCVPERVPARVRALVAMGLTPVEQTVRRVLALAAAASATEISLSELRTGAAALEPPVSDVALLHALDRALQMRVLEERKSGYAFRHPLVRAAVYEDLSRHRRDEVHAALDRSRAESSRRLRVAAAG